MTPQERDLLTRFLDELVRAQPGAKDAEAAQQIETTLRSNPDAAYVLVQHAIVADAALRDAQAQMAELQRRLDQQGAQAPAEQPSFLGSLFGRAQPNDRSGQQVGQAGPWSQPASAVPPTGGYGQPYPPQGGAGAFGGGPFSGGGGLGGFLRGAGTTAAGVAGGAFLFEGLRDMFGGGEHDRGFGGQGFADQGFSDQGQGFADAGGSDSFDVGSGDGDYDDSNT